jgi:uncharacterized RDD family membrane protein YckC
MDQIQEYISKARLAGQTDEQIRQSLLLTGWLPEQLSAYFNVANYPQNIPTPSPPTIPTSTTQAGYPPAGAWGRFWATVIDSLYLFLVSYVLFIPIALVSGTSVQAITQFDQIEHNIIFGIIYLLLYFIYSVSFTVSRGATPGKDAYGFQVVRYQTTDKVRYVAAIIRESIKTVIVLIPIIGGLIYFINGLVIIFSKEKRGFHDLAAGTQVLKTKKAWSIWKQILLILLPIMLMISLLIYSMFQKIYSFNRSTTEINNQPDKSILNQTGNTEPTPFPLDTNTWKIYRINDDQNAYGYTIKYPDGLYMQEDSTWGWVKFSNYPIMDANTITKDQLAHLLDNEFKISTLQIQYGLSINPNDLSDDVSRRSSESLPQTKTKINSYDAISVNHTPESAAGYDYDKVTYYVRASTGGVYSITKTIGTKDLDTDRIFSSMLNSFTMQ